MSRITTPLKKKMQLIESIQNARQHCNNNEVWCITRFDRQNATLEIYWSERNVPGAITTATLGAGGLRRPYGGPTAHAECIMVRDFARAVGDYGHVPGRVEIFLSRSPCTVSGQFNFGGINYPVGCAQKIMTLIQNNPGVNFWDIRYDDIYWGNPNNRPDPNSNTLSGSVDGLGILSSLNNVSIHRFNTLDVVP